MKGQNDKRAKLYSTCQNGISKWFDNDDKMLKGHLKEAYILKMIK